MQSLDKKKYLPQLGSMNIYKKQKLFMIRLKIINSKKNYYQPQELI